MQGHTHVVGGLLAGVAAAPLLGEVGVQPIGQGVALSIVLLLGMVTVALTIGSVLPAGRPPPPLCPFCYGRSPLRMDCPRGF